MNFIDLAVAPTGRICAGYDYGNYVATLHVGTSIPNDTFYIHPHCRPTLALEEVGGPDLRQLYQHNDFHWPNADRWRRAYCVSCMPNGRADFERSYQ